MFTLLKLSNRASIIKNKTQANKATTPTVIPKPHADGSPLSGHLPLSYKSSDEIHPKTRIANNFFMIKN